MEIEVSAIPPDGILPIWNKIAPLFEKAIERRQQGSLESIFNRLAIQKRDLLWMVWEKDNLENILTVVITRVIKGTTYNILEIVFCGGEKKYLWMEHFPTLEKFAKENNCTKIQIKNGRKGWKKELDKYGMKVTGYTFEKNI
jgi:hypothetical protein